MPPLYIKPENALKRSEELLALGTAQSREQAFENLIEVFQSKRFKLTPIATLEPIVVKFLDLCVDLQRRSHARYALLAYRNAVQTNNSQSVENVLNHFIAQAESRLAAATEQAKTEVSALPENPTVDDELPLQPSDMLLDTFIDNTNDRERIERRLIAPAQKFCYDAYDTSLDVCKGNDRLELVYQSIAQRAFKFCVIHQRKTDFRRLCEQRLRKDLANAAKYGHQQHAINLSDPETLSRHLDTRFLQLETAVELELWQEAFRSVEDVHGLVAGKKGAKPSMMANYYEKLTQIFKAEGGKQTAVFHAAAWARYFQYAERAGSTPEKAPGCVLLSALAVPLGEVETKQRLIALLNLPKMPTRDALVKDAAAKHLRRVPAAIRQIYNALEVDFQPLKAAKMLAPVISSLPEEYQPYLPALREVVLSRLLSGLSEVYDTVSLSHVVSLVQPFDATAWKTDMPSLEKFLMTSARRGEINASIDHVAKSLTFTTPTVDTNRLSNLAVCLYNTMQYLNPAPVSRSDAFTAAIAQAEEERKQAQHRRQIVIKRRELLEEANIRRVKEESTAKAEKARQLAEETSRREKEYQRQAEKERIQREIDATRREEAKKLAESLQAKGALKVDMKDIEDLDSNQVLALQVQQLDKEKREMADRLRIVGKRVDHLERAMRKEERPLLAQDYERQKEEDKINHEKANKMAREEAVARQAAEKELKERLGRMMPDYLEARKAVESQRAAEFERAREEAGRKVEAEKEKFKAKVLERRKREKERREKERQEDEERERAEAERAEAEARAAAEEEEREAAAKAEIERRNAEAAAQAEERRKERDAERAEAAAAAERQRQREEEAEKSRAERAGGGARAPIRPNPSTATPPASSSAAPPTIVRPAGASGWRERLAAKAAGGGGDGTATPPTASTPTTAYTPPARVNGTASPAPAQAAPARTESPAQPAQNGEEKPATKGVYQPGQGRWTARGRGGGATGSPSPSTRGGAARGGSRW